jgi:hypothetical protein
MKMPYTIRRNTDTNAICTAGMNNTSANAGRWQQQQRHMQSAADSNDVNWDGGYCMDAGPTNRYAMHRANTDTDHASGQGRPASGAPACGPSRHKHQGRPHTPGLVTRTHTPDAHAHGHSRNP